MSGWRLTTKYGVVTKDYTPRSPHCLALNFGDTVHILEENGDWFRGRALKRHSKWGIFPANHVHLKPCHVDARGQIESTEDPVAREVADVLREWGTIMKGIYKKKGQKKFMKLREVALELIEWRSQILSGTLPDDHLKELKSKVTTKIDWGNRDMQLDLIPRNAKGEVIDSDSTSVINLFKVHNKSVETGSRTTNTGSIRRTLSPATLLKAPPKMHHLLFKHSAFACSIGEETDVYYSLYDSTVGEFISEAYYLRLTKKGFPYDVENLDNMSCVFTELSTRIVGSSGAISVKELFLVCRIIRLGPMEFGKELKKATFRRPVGVAVVSLRQLIDHADNDQEIEESMQVYKCDEDNFCQLHEHIIKGNASKYSVLDRAKGVTVRLKMLTGDLMQVRKENPLLFKKGTGIARKRGFPEVIMPGDVRNDFYLTLCSANFESGRKLRPKNIEATLMVCLKDGSQLRDCIVIGAGDKPRGEYATTIYYHTNSPKWFETIKLDIPIDKFEDAHIKVYFKHCSSTESKDKSPPFCFAFIPLMKANSSGITIEDAEHEIRVYKYDDRYDSTNGTPAYLTNPSMQSSQNEKLVIRTLICSTKLTHNPYLLDLLKWKQQPGNLHETLKHLTYVQGEDIVKFLTDIFDAVFSILDSHPEHAHQVFEALVYLFGLLGDKKFHNFAAVLDAYIQRHFSGAMAHKALVGCLKHQIKSAESPEAGSSVRAAMKGLEYIFKFIIRSRELYHRARPQSSSEEFKAELLDLFKSFNGMMRLRQPTVQATQDMVLQYFASIFTDLDKIFSITDMATIACQFVECVHFSDKHNKYQLAFMKSLVQGPVFQHPEGRSRLLPAITRILQSRLDKKDELVTCLEILGDILTTLQEDQGDTYADVLQVVNPLLNPVIQIAMKMKRHHAAAGELLACLLALLHLMNDASIKCKTHNQGRDPYKEYLASHGSNEKLAAFLLSIFKVFDVLVTNNALPSDWIVMRMLQNDVILNTVQFLSEALRSTFLSGPSFHFELWDSFFKLSVAYLCQSNLQLEEFSEVKRDKILAKHGDKRELMAYQIASMWQELGDHQIQFIPSLVGPLLRMALVPETQLRKLTIPIFFDMMECEVASSNTFTRVETEIIDKLDVYVTEGRGDTQFKELVNGILLEKCKKSKHKIIKSDGPRFVDAVRQLLTRLLALRDVPSGPEFRDQRAACIFDLLKFYKGIDRTQMYIRYIYKLSDIHVAAQHYAEAAFTLKLHAELLDWTDEELEALFDSPESSAYRYPAQSERARQAAIYHRAIDLFDQGHSWEEALPLCKTLAEQYETELFDYVKLRDILRKQAQFFDNIISKQRDEPQYFRVGYWGQGFPEGVRNKEFVYRGWKKDHITVFCDRVQCQFPQSQLIMNKPPTDAMKAGSDMHISITKVDSKPDPDVVRFKGKAVRESLKAYYNANELCQFSYDRPFRKGEKTGNEFETLWVETCTITTAEPLPGLLNRSEVVDTESREVSPIENAISAMSNKNVELQEIIGRHAKDPSLNVNPLTMSLNGVIDAAVMGGTDKYREAFFHQKYIDANTDHGEFIDRLKLLISQQLEILELGVQIHGKYCPENLKPMQEKLETQLAQMKKKDSTPPSRSSSISSMSSRVSKSPRRPTSDGSAGGGGGGGVQRSTSAQSLPETPKPRESNINRSQSVRPASAISRPKNNPFQKAQSGPATPSQPLPPPRTSVSTTASPAPSSNPFSAAGRPQEPLPKAPPASSAPETPTVPARSSRTASQSVGSPRAGAPAPPARGATLPARTTMAKPADIPSEAPPPRPKPSSPPKPSRDASTGSLGAPPRPSAKTKPKAVIQAASSSSSLNSSNPFPGPAKSPKPKPAVVPKKSNPFSVSPEKKEKKPAPAVPRRTSGVGAGTVPGLGAPPSEPAPPRPKTAKPAVVSKSNPFPPSSEPPQRPPKT